MVIQRSWKILSDTGSTSASSTEANRSPSGLQSSSDDSNCSNQTTHSMVTSVASPPAMKHETPATASSGGTPTTEPMKYVTTPHMAELMLQRLKQRLSCPVQVTGTGSTAESAMRSMELLRISVQQAFDAEIDVIMKRFMESYFKPAFQNIKENLGQTVVSEDMLQKMSCALLENAKAQYNAFRVKPQLTCLTNMSSAHAPTIMDTSSLRFAIRRPAPKTIIDINECPSKKLLTTVSAQHQLGSIVPGGAIKSTTLSFAPAMSQQQQTQPQQALPQLQQQKPPPPTVVTVAAAGTTAAVPTRRQIFWNTAHISTATKFVLDVQANQAFGFGTDGKERLASKHPELIRYLPDNEDREWLTLQNIIATQNRNSRFLFLIHDEVCRLQQTHEVYRSKANIDLSVMHTFTVPDFMIQKMKLFFVDLNIKSRGLITNSFSVGAGGGVHGNSHLRNALLQGMTAQTGGSNNNNGSSSGTNGINNGNNTTSGSGDVDADMGATTTTTTTPAGTVFNNNASTNNITVCSGESTNGASQQQQQQQQKPSTLSSSHATLTALLNNSVNAPPEKNVTTKLRK